MLSRTLDLALAWFPADRRLWKFLRELKYGCRHRLVGSSRVRVAELRVRKEPVMLPACAGAQGVRLLAHPIDRYFPLIRGIEDRRIEHLPHVALLRHHDSTGNLPVESEYGRLLRARANLERAEITDEVILGRMHTFIATHRSIACRGYLGPGHRRARIVIAESPLHPATETYRPEPFEIFDGHHRAASLFYLGIEYAEVMVARTEVVRDFSWNIESVPRRPAT